MRVTLIGSSHCCFYLYERKYFTAPYVLSLFLFVKRMRSYFYRQLIIHCFRMNIIYFVVFYFHPIYQERENKFNQVSHSPFHTAHNPLSHFPSAMIRGLQKLETFDCSGCSLGPTLSNGLLEFHSQTLESVVINGNNISWIEPSAITGMTITISNIQTIRWIISPRYNILGLRKRPFPILRFKIPWNRIQSSIH